MGWATTVAAENAAVRTVEVTTINVQEDGVTMILEI